MVLSTHCKLLQVVVFTAFSALITACGSDVTPNALLADGSSGSGDVTPTDSSQPQGGAGCAEELNILDEVDSPTTWANTSAECDYLLSGFVKVNSTLTIEPGVVIRATNGGSIHVSGGQIIANGTADNRIVMEGVEHTAGYWNGISFWGARPSSFHYVDLVDAGQDCGELFCSKSAMYVNDVELAFTHSTISNSYVHGMDVDPSALLTEFSNNRFFGNAYAGIVIDGTEVPNLDSGSDYVGMGNPNGTPYVQVTGGHSGGREYRWKKLNTEYLMPGIYHAEGGTWVIDPGVTLLMRREAVIVVRGNAVFKAIGSADSPVSIRGQVAEFDYWQGIWFDQTPWNSNELFNVDIRHSGYVDALSLTLAAIHMDESRVKINNTTFKDNGNYAVWCNEGDDLFGFFDWSYVSLGTGNTFENNVADIHSDCVVN